MHLNYFLVFCLCLMPELILRAQVTEGKITGKVTSSGNPLPFASVGLQGTSYGAITANDGTFSLDRIPAGNYLLQISFLGYETWLRPLVIKSGQNQLNIQAELEKSLMALNELVVTGTRSEKRRLDSAVPVNILDSRMMQSTQSLNLSEGLSFQPGIRIEKDCQTCNYTQVRMNGLGGSYTQILLNSKPLFSSLAGLYGLEQFPASMIDRVEIVRGGGSVLYGSNAIAGTINILTKDPSENDFHLSSTGSMVNGEATDLQTDVDAALVSKSKKSGGNLIISKRNRNAWDANDDGFSELSKINNLSFGLSTFLKTSLDSKLRFSINSINEIRNGGDRLDQEPHLRLQSEFRDSRILAGNLDYSYDFYGKRSRLDVYAGIQQTIREHYTGSYGADGYGDSDNKTFVYGIQMNHRLLNTISGSNLITLGMDHQYDYVKDQIAAYNYFINQETFQTGIFLQSDWDLHRKINLVTGIRFTKHNKVENIITTPRINLLYKITAKSQLRVSFAKGFRAPQAFDTDLHIAFSGGGVAITVLDPNLKPEKSVSYTASYDYNLPHQKYIYGFTFTGFLTHLNETFVLVEQPVPVSGDNTELLRTNGSDATVKGITVEARLNYNYRIEIDLGWTFQNNQFDKTVQWSNSTPATREFLRTPGHYGYFAVNITPIKLFQINFSGVHTGNMAVLHLAGAPNVPSDKLVDTQEFVELNFKTEYCFPFIKQRINLFLSCGIQNFTNSFQSDFDEGPNRDSNYIYGPGRPRTYFAGIRLQRAHD